MAKHNRNFAIQTAKLTQAEKPKEVTVEEKTEVTSVETPVVLTTETLRTALKNREPNEIAALAAPVLAEQFPEDFRDADGRLLTVEELLDSRVVPEEESDTDDGLDFTEGESDFTDCEEEPNAEGEVGKQEQPVEVPWYTTQPNNWTVEQLETYIKGDVPDVSYNVLKTAISEHQRRETSLDLAWNPQQCKEFLTQGIIPRKTTKGAWVSDVSRFARNASQWTTQELESWALGEIRPEGSTSDYSLAAELKERLILTAKSNSPEDVIIAYKAQTGQTTVTTHLTGDVPTATPPKVDVEAASIKLSYEGLTTVNQTYIEETLKRYKEACAPGKPLTIQTGLMAQKQLDNVIRYVINLEDPVGFKNGMEIIRKFITDNRKAPGMFDDSHAFRFTDGLSVQGSVQESHIQILTLFCIFADENKEARSQYDIPSLVSLFPPARQPLLLQYFQQVQ